MKNAHNPIRLILLFFAFSLALNGQPPCGGTPASNTILPASHTVCAGNVASMSLATTYTTSGITYQWYSSSVSSVGPFSPIPGATLSTHTSGSLTANIYYNLVITCTIDGLSITVPHTVYVFYCSSPCSGSPGTNTILPATQTLCAGDVATMSLAATYTDSGIAYQWGASSSPGGPFTAIPGATLSTHTSSALTSNTYFNVTITCTNSSLSYSTTAAVSVISCTYCSGTPGSNTVLPVSQTVCVGSSFTMSLANTYTSSGIIYQWQSSTVSAGGPFTSIPGATLSTYTSTPLSAGVYYYNVLITCTNSGMSTSVPHVVYVVTCNSPCSGSPAAGTIVPATQTLCLGDVATLSLATTYFDSGIAYQWGTSASPGGPFTAIPGATLSTYTSSPLNANTYFNITVTCTNSSLGYSTTSAVSVISCTYCSGTPGTNTVMPLTYTLCTGNSASLSLANSYTASGIIYQWQSSTTSISGPFSSIPGATLSTYISPTLTANVYYRVIITCTNSGGNIMPARSVLVFTCTGTGLDNSMIQDAGIAVYPNPNTGEFTVESKDHANGSLVLTDLPGRIVFTAQYTGGAIKVNMKDLPNGMYYLQLRDAKGIKVIKVLKE